MGPRSRPASRAQCPRRPALSAGHRVAASANWERLAPIRILIVTVPVLRPSEAFITDRRREAPGRRVIRAAGLGGSESYAVLRNPGVGRRPMRSRKKSRGSKPRLLRAFQGPVTKNPCRSRASTPYVRGDDLGPQPHPVIPGSQKPRSVAGVHTAPFPAHAGDRRFTSLTAAAYLLLLRRRPRRTRQPPQLRHICSTRSHSPRRT